ncbi:short-chain dehydrogenase/reductase [Bradyrhizobium sp. PRIMUS42]|uniref:short-chain dehydrogenase/reductase n=1 Tax=Bradyrhizobium sp. PRIMUS42 TaxID=2908926 RepID=UPI001FF1E84C|nr:short-chain dehydrogenase/reductase [Bradyrhizobium sp. PRIMUS42]MCJ9728651.1 short-chain dehydrogenase/reductase [Bradyrhizobium sp. PRIMUS42]
MDLGLKGKCVVITGGSRGIGFACAKAFLEEGGQVTIVGRNEQSVRASADKLSREHGARIVGLSIDLGKQSDALRLQESLRSADVVVNNAGAIPGGGLLSIDDDTWRQAWELKVYGYLNAVRTALPAMMDRRSGVIVNVIGIAGANPRYDYVCGSMANASLISFTKAVGAHATSKGVRVVGVNPGPTRTERLISLYRGIARERFGDEERWQDCLTHLPFGRPATPEEMADLVVFLSSARASYLSGVVIDADGGAMYAPS